MKCCKLHAVQFRNTASPLPIFYSGSQSIFNVIRFSSYWDKLLNLQNMGFGDYPIEYNPSVHGPYDPARYYGKPDTPFGQVKLGEIGSWLARRNKSPQAMVSCMSRAWWRWQHKYIHPKKAGIAGFFQLTTGAMIFFYALNYSKIKQHRNYKYH